MYNAKIITDAGKSFEFSYQNGVLFDITPLSGTAVSVATSQGFQQIGATVEGQSVGGVSRTIKGKVLTRDTARRMVSALPVFTEGRLYVNGMYYCPIAVSATPEVVTKSTGEMPFTMRVFCSSPYWYSSKETNVVLNDYTPAFSFPVLYDSHTFGIASDNVFVNVYNPGEVPADMEVLFYCDGDVTNYGIANVLTGDVLQFEDVLLTGETVTLKRSGGRVLAVKVSGGEETSILGTITDESSLFSLAVGDNILRVIADDAENSLRASITFNAAYMGLIV